MTYSPNQSIKAYKGEFFLKYTTGIISVTGLISFEWYPSIRLTFTGNCLDVPSSFNIALFVEDHYEIIVEGNTIAECFITDTDYDEVSLVLEGHVLGKSIIGNKTAPVSYVEFFVPNLKKLREHNPTEASCFSSGSLLEFRHHPFTINIKSEFRFDDQHNSLVKKGGYLVLYTGRIKHDTHNISLDKANEVLQCFSMFLNFINGFRTAPVIRKGIHADEIIWTDYTGFINDEFKRTASWTPSDNKINKLNDMWEAFCNLWADENHRDFLTSIIHWYTEANLLSGYLEGAIIMAQTGLELIYNWLVVEQSKFIIGNDADNISAANKIRLILSILCVENDIPKPLKNLKLTLANEIIDAPSAFVQLRNSIVHSQSNKRKKLSETDNITKAEALHLAIWYIELSILKILGYKGFYTNRCKTIGKEFFEEEMVPWMVKSN